jgi:hypothetical protein
MASVLDIFVSTLPLVLAGIHAALESRAARIYSDAASDPPRPEQGYSLLWLASCIGFVSYELFVAYSMLWLSAITRGDCMSVRID